MHAHQGQFPFHTAIFYDSQYRCGASLISQKSTLTAAHCVVDLAQNILLLDEFYLLFGTIDLQVLSGNEALRKVEKIIKHTNYQHDKVLKQDIAIMIIRGNLQFSENIRPICLPHYQPSMSTKINQDLFIIGFGSSVESLAISRYLQYGEMTIISREECTEQIILALLPEQTTFCAKAKDQMMACPGRYFNLIFKSVKNNLMNFPR